MKHRVLNSILVFLLLFSAHIGTDVRTALFDESDDIKIVTTHTSSQEISPALFSESRIIEQSVVRSQRKSGVSFHFENNVFLTEKSSYTEATKTFRRNPISTRVLLLPKSIQNVIFLQTVI
ncbi:MAG: hypothetical protein IKO57_13095 [Treponema sp.]|nr:hypothetical protein [Treponema sp.]MBR4631355.1 hypothetical protein [Treponema sp.]MCR5125382.1 hypothetical protein [Treponema sp.]